MFIMGIVGTNLSIKADDIVSGYSAVMSYARINKMKNIKITCKIVK